ncbi:MAG: metallophosphoesterase [Methanoregulaceae archaeon]|nr:metallophosphoesterase [Methanoregulaceae archaeon]
MKIIHIADTHLGLAAFNRLDPESGMNLREKQIYDNFLSAVDKIIEAKPDVLVHAGDLFDTVKPKTRAYTTILEALERLHCAGVPFIVIAGNHSMVKTRYTTSPFEVLSYHHSKIHAAYRFRYEHVEIGDTVFHLIPNMLRPEDYRTAYDQVGIVKDRYNVLVTHGLASALKDKRLATVAEHELDSTILSDRFDYIALGHYHRQVQITDNAWYSGSPEYMAYGEIADTKGGLLVDLDHTSAKTLPVIVTSRSSSSSSPEPFSAYSSVPSPASSVHECREYATVLHFDLPKTPMVDLGTILCEGVHVGDITSEIIARITDRCIPPLSMVQVTLDGMSREHGKGIDLKELAGVKEKLLDLKIRSATKDQGEISPLQQDVKAIDYLQEFSSFVGKQQMSARQREYVAQCGLDLLRTVMEDHKGDSE